MTTVETRSWKYRPEVFEVPNRVNRFGSSALRNDGQQFRAFVDFDPRYQEQARVALIDTMETFLDPNCECVVGHNCAMHVELEKP